jgi:hypothetical protein
MSQRLETSTVTQEFFLPKSAPTKKSLFSFEAVSNFCTSCSQKVSRCFKAIFSAIACPFKSAYSAIKSLCGRVFVSKQNWNPPVEVGDSAKKALENIAKKTGKGQANAEEAFETLKQFCDNVSTSAESASDQAPIIKASVQTSSKEARLLVWIDARAEIGDSEANESDAFQNVNFEGCGFKFRRATDLPRELEDSDATKGCQAFEITRLKNE